jgi:hypothetical protein
VAVEGDSERIFRTNICCRPGLKQELTVMNEQGHRVLASLRDNGQTVRRCVRLFKRVGMGMARKARFHVEISAWCRACWCSPFLAPNIRLPSAAHHTTLLVLDSCTNHNHTLNAAAFRTSKCFLTTTWFQCSPS